MNKALSVQVRPLGPRDHLRFPELEDVRACAEALASFDGELKTELSALLGELGAHLTLAQPASDGSYTYLHFGAAIAAQAGFDMTGKVTRDFDGPTRHHIESTFNQVLLTGEPLCTIMDGLVGAAVHSWQRIVFPVHNAAGDFALAFVKPLHRALDTVHARQRGVAVCVVPLRASESETGYELSTEEPLLDYLGPCDLKPIQELLKDVKIGEEAPNLGSLLATRSCTLSGSENEPLDVLIDVVHGFTTPFLVVLNVSASTKANDELRSSSLILETTFDVGHLGSCVSKSEDATYVFATQELGEIFGLPLSSEGTIQLADVRRCYVGSFKEEVQQAVCRCWRNGDDYAVEGKFARPDGTTIYIRISGRPMRDPTGKVVSVFGIVQDITEQQAAKHKLEESEARFRDFAGSAGDWCWETDDQHRFVDFTEGLEEVGHYSQTHFVGMTRRDFPLVEEDRVVIERHFQDLNAHREFKDVIYRLRDPALDGVTTYQISGKPRFSEDGAFLGYRGTGRNITDLVAAQHENEVRMMALRSAQSIAGIGHWITDLSSGRTRWSDGILRLFGFQDGLSGDPDRLVDDPRFNMHWLMRRVHKDDRSKVLDALRGISAEQPDALIDVRYSPEDDRSLRHMRVQLRFEPGNQLTAPRQVGIAQDVTDLKGVQDELRKRTEALDQAQAMGGIGDWQFDARNGQVQWSDQLFVILGLDAASFHPDLNSFASLCTGADRDAFLAQQARALEEGVISQLDVQARRGDGTIGYYSTLTKPVKDSTGRITGLFGTVQDITERKHAEKQLRSLAFFDPLTGLANRALFSRELSDVLSTVVRKGGSAALLLLDLDHFKEVNDTLGHAAGDELLQSVARTLKEELDPKGFVARLGGDEFAIIIRNYSSVDCLRRFADRIISRLSGVLELKRGEVITGTSLGIALVPQDGGTTEEVLRHADLALYMAKDDGRGRALFFKPSMSRSVEARLRLARDLKTALDDDALETRYQGQVDLNTGKVVGFETLVRWKHPSRGYISPSEFIPVAESSSLISDIGLWVIKDACRTGRRWLDAGEVPRMISVNVSPAQIWQTDFEDEVLEIIENTGFPPEYLCIELTENVFADHSEGRVRAALGRFKEVGIHLALDDFGTGYSSLGYLNDLPFDELKIDRCFVEKSDASAEKARLLQGIVALGKGLGMRVVGEGAETEGEVELLRELGCDVVQGFVFMRPEVAADAVRSADQLEFRLLEHAGWDGIELDERRTA